MTGTRITVQAGSHGRRYCPVQEAIDSAADTKADGFALFDESGGRSVPHQIWTKDRKRVIGWIIDDLPEGAERTYVLKEAQATAAAGVAISDTGEAMRFSVGESDFTTYNYGSDVVRPYFYPLYIGSGIGITRNWPMISDVENETDDHPHHKGLYTAQGEVNGVDNWGEGEGHGYQIHDGFDEVFEGPVAGGFAERLLWTDADRQPNLAERRRITIYSTPAGVRIIDYDVTFSAEFGDVILGDTKEGGLLSVRVATSMDGERPDGGTILNSFGGKTEAETWGKRAQWCDYSGPIRGDWYGICMMDHPGNPRHPTYWHVRDYGLMTANCFGVHHFTADPENRKDFPIPEGASVTWRYRALLHAGRSELTQLTRCYHDFANPPQITVE